MSRQLFVNLPVKDLKRSVDFYTALGFSFNPKFTDDNATCMIIADDIFVMLLVEQYFATFTSKPVADPGRQTGALLALSLDSREAVDTMVALAIDAGARAPLPAQDHGFMYQRSFEDPDGHQWEPFHMSGDPP